MIIEERLSDITFKKLSDYFYNHTGIMLKEYKKYLVEYRLGRFVGENNRFKSFEELYNELIRDKTGEIKTLLVQALTTNYTYFFRDEIHFEFLKEYLIEKYKERNYIRIWSAGCATGEEAYSAAMVSLEVIPEIKKMDFRILATDISINVLKYAIEGRYHYTKMKSNMPDYLLKKYFIYDKEHKTFIIKEEVKELVYFRYLNLMGEYPFQKKFDIVFLRNVLIYFGNKEKEIILRKIYNVIKEDGYLILGLSESLIGTDHPFKLIKNSIYSKI